MFTDDQRRSVWQQLRQRDLRAFRHLLSDDLLQQAAREAGVAMGRGPLCLATLAWLSIACALHTARNFADVLTLTLKLLHDASTWGTDPLARRCRRRPRRSAKHDPRPAHPSVLSEEAFVQARNKAPITYWLWLILLLGRKFTARYGPGLCWRGHRLLALDGTTLALQNYKALRQHFGTAANGKQARSTQARMVMLSYPLARFPLRYELCPLSKSEKTCAATLLSGLCPGDLVLMDKGFWSYGLFQQIASQQAFFAIRLVQGVKLKTLRRLSCGDRLVRWQPSDRKWRDLPPFIDLRVIEYQVPGFRPTALVTNLTDRRIGRRSWVGLASVDPAGVTLHGGVYHRRWEIETTFSELKVHQKLEGSLRGRTPAAIEFEVAGHVLLYLLVRWLMVEAAQKAGLDPLRLSYLHALRELEDIAPALLTASASRAACVLVPRLLARVAAHRVPWRPGRHYPRPGETTVRYKGRGHYRLPSKLAVAEA